MNSKNMCSIMATMTAALAAAAFFGFASKGGGVYSVECEVEPRLRSDFLALDELPPEHCGRIDMMNRLVEEWRKDDVADSAMRIFRASRPDCGISDDELRNAIKAVRMRLGQRRMTIVFSATAEDAEKAACIANAYADAAIGREERRNAERRDKAMGAFEEYADHARKLHDEAKTKFEAGRESLPAKEAKAFAERLDELERRCAGVDKDRERARMAIAQSDVVVGFVRRAYAAEAKKVEHAR